MLQSVMMQATFVQFFSIEVPMQWITVYFGFIHINKRLITYVDVIHSFRCTTLVLFEQICTQLTHTFFRGIV